MNEETTFAIYDDIVVSIGKWEPRINILYSASYVEPDYDNHTYDIYLTFTIVGVDTTRFNYVGKLKSITKG